MSSILLISHGFNDLQVLCSIDERCSTKSSLQFIQIEQDILIFIFIRSV